MVLSRKNKRRREQSRLPVLEDDTLVALYEEDLERIGAFSHLLSREEEVELGKLVEQGDIRSFEDFFVFNARLAMHWAKKYIYRGMEANLEYIDLIQEGNIGLLKGIERWDPGRGIKISTYASYWIEQGIQRAIYNNGAIRIPVNIRPELKKMLDLRDKCHEETGQWPTTWELAKLTGFPPEKIERLFKALLAMRFVSLDTPIIGVDSHGAEVEVVPSEVIADEQFEPNLALDKIETPWLKQLLREILEPIEWEIIRSRFGFDSAPLLTMEEIAENLGVPRKQVWEKEREVLFKLWQNPEVRKLFADMTGAEPSRLFNPQSSLGGPPTDENKSYRPIPKLYRAPGSNLVHQIDQTKVGEIGDFWEQQERRQEQLSILKDWKDRTILFKEIKGQGHWS